MTQDSKSPFTDENDDILPEIGSTGKVGVRGKYYKKFRKGHTVRIYEDDGSVTVEHFPPMPTTIVIARDVSEYFPDEESVNNALRTLIALVQRQSV